MLIWGDPDSPERSRRGWALRQIVTFHNLAARAEWRERQFQAAIHGVDLGQEPEWDLGGAAGAPATLSGDDYQAWRQKREQSKGGGSGG